MKKFGNIMMVLALTGSILAGCGQNTEEGKNTGGENKEQALSGEVAIDGSSTVGPISEAVAEAFMEENGEVNVTVGISGTGGGMKRFIAGEIDFADASRKIKEEELADAQKNNLEPIEIPVAYDGITVVVNKENTWVDKLTVDELKKIWEPNSTVKTWADVREGWPAEPIKLYGPGTESGTFEYFTEKVVGEAKASRTDYTPSEDDNVLVQGVKGDKNALGYFGFSYYEENADQLKAVPIDNGTGNAVAPSLETIADGSYAPLSRMLYIYVSKSSLESKPQVKAFVKFYLENAETLVKEAKYIPLSADQYKEHLGKVE